MTQSKLSSVLEIAKGTLITIVITALCESVLPMMAAFTASLILSTGIKYAIRRYYNKKTLDKNS